MNDRRRLQWSVTTLAVVVAAAATLGYVVVAFSVLNDDPTPPPSPPPLREQQVGDHSTCILQGNVVRACYSRASRSQVRTPAPAPASPPAARVAPARGTPGRTLRVTGYCWTGNRTASGVWPQPGMAATLDRTVPFGTVLDVQGLGRYTVTDRIGHGSDVDLYLGRGADCERRASRFGVQRLVVRGVR